MAPVVHVSCFQVDGRDDGLYLFADPDDRDAFARAVVDAGGNGHCFEDVLLDAEGARSVINAERRME